MNEKDFAEKLRPWLDKSSDDLGEIQLTRLKAARLRALDAYREPVSLLGLVTVGRTTVQTLQYSVFQRGLMILPIVALMAALALQSGPPDADFGDLDAQLLAQELPPGAFLDADFRSWLGSSSP